MNFMKAISQDIFTQAIRKDFLALMIDKDTSIDFCEYVAHQLCSNKKTIACKFRDGFWNTKDFEKILIVTEGKYLRKAFMDKSKQ